MDGYCCSRRFLVLQLLRYCWCVALWRRSTGKCLKVQWSASFVPLQPLRLSLPVNWVEAHPALTTYTLLSNLLAAVAVPLVFPLVEPHADITFFVAFLKILSKVFPLLLCPFLLAWFLRAFVPKVHHFLLGFHDACLLFVGR